MNDDLRQRHQLLKIGTARAGRLPAGLNSPLDTLLPLAQTGAPEAALWLSLGALDVWERSGYLPPDASGPAPQPAPAEQLRPCPPQAEATLSMLLRGLHPANLQSDWLRLLHRYGGHLPARFLPALLDAGTRQHALRAELLPVLGERGRWLARLNGAWSWALGTNNNDDAWNTGTLEQRLAALRTWRAQDPRTALDALAAAWPTETPEQRATLLQALGVNLSLDDETFVEAALDDRRKEVRVAAQGLLARLPGSQLGQRMLVRLQALMRFEKPLLRPARIELTLPADCDAAMRRDGIGAAPHPGLGEKAGWVADMLAAVDPRTWSRQFARAPRACVALAEHSEFAAALVRGWALAALRITDTEAEADAAPDAMEWPQALALWWLGASPALRDAVPTALFDLIAARFHEDRGGTSSAFLDALPDSWSSDSGITHLLYRLIDGADAGWTPVLTRRALQRLRIVRPTLLAPGQPNLARLLLPAFGRVADPVTALGFEAEWRGGLEPGSPLQASISTFFDLVRARHEMILSFQESA